MQRYTDHNGYEYLAYLLSNEKSTSGQELLIEELKKSSPHWGKLLFQADCQFITPLLYQRLSDDHLTQYLPQDFHTYLAELFTLNRERNREILLALKSLVEVLNLSGITPLLLKGVASLVQNIYPDDGARILSDLDILVRPDEVPTCEAILQKMGYEEVPEPNREPDDSPTDFRHHHINPYVDRTTGVMVEIHTNTGYAITSHILPGSLVLGEAQDLEFEGMNVKVMTPTHQVLLNALHGLLPHREFISGKIELRQLYEFYTFSRHFESAINWNECLIRTRSHGVETEFKTYRHLSEKLFHHPLPDMIQIGLSVRMHGERIISKGNLNRHNGDSFTLSEQLQRIAHRFYYLIRMPHWIWTHPCFAVGPDALRARVRMLFRKLFDPNAWKKI